MTDATLFGIGGGVFCTWSFRGSQSVLYFDVQNVYGRNNISSYRWDPRTRAREADESLGFLPSIGVNIEF